MSKIYVDQILPKENAQISAPNLQLPAGSVVQVVSSGEISNNEHVTSTSFVDTLISVTITPKSVNSKILVNAYFYMMTYGASRSRGAVRLKRTISGSSTVASGGIAETLHIRESSAGASTELSAMQSYQYYDSPGTTEPVTYTIECAYTSGAGVYLYGTTSNSPKNIVATEIAG